MTAWQKNGAIFGGLAAVIVAGVLLPGSRSSRPSDRQIEAQPKVDVAANNDLGLHNKHSMKLAKDLLDWENRDYWNKRDWTQELIDICEAIELLVYHNPQLSEEEALSLILQIANDAGTKREKIPALCGYGVKTIVFYQRAGFSLQDAKKMWLEDNQQYADD